MGQRPHACEPANTSGETNVSQAVAADLRHGTRDGMAGSPAPPSLPYATKTATAQQHPNLNTKTAQARTTTTTTPRSYMTKQISSFINMPRPNLFVFELHNNKRREVGVVRGQPGVHQRPLRPAPPAPPGRRRREVGGNGGASGGRHRRCGGEGAAPLLAALVDPRVGGALLEPPGQEGEIDLRVCDEVAWGGGGAFLCVCVTV